MSAAFMSFPVLFDFLFLLRALVVYRTLEPSIVIFRDLRRRVGRDTHRQIVLVIGPQGDLPPGGAVDFGVSTTLA